ncbi:sensor histidine kinase [Nocardioides zeae]|uniref:Signal transduction histidine kinase n=1 Tax=Nocardioides zeae TaxID=1457234 RepID=A0AAJ1U0X3_9ACTN|nr:sensor histidine kinase [Nocardioides zeae]MDQ1103213.1 signal transduction histidine kinase [Nocardioides zeae]
MVRPFEIGAVARILGLCAVAGPALWLRDTRSLAVVLLFAIVWLVATSLSALRWVPKLALAVAEAVAVAAICGYAVVEADAVPVLALAIPPFLGGLSLGIRGAAGLILVEIAVLGLVLVQLETRPPVDASGQLLATLAFGLGVGLVGAYLRFNQSRQAELTPYRDAIDLLQQLLALTDVLDAGLDPQSIGARLLSTLQDDIPAIRASLWLRDERGLTPVPTGSLLESAGHGTQTGTDVPDTLVAALDDGRPVLSGGDFALPLASIGGRLLLIEGELSPSPAGGRRGLVQRLEAASARLVGLTTQLDTALVFAEVNAAATRNERHRLAREMHDGVAQDIASMGYLVDAMADGPLPDDLRPQVELLRGTISRVVGEVRASVTALRMDVDANQSLGEAISGLARRLSDSSGLSIRCTVDERAIRLRPDVEAELLRIAQEAMTNAVKHAGASEIDVECLVDAPRARIVVRDNGTGLGPAREDSHGMTIMRERAQLVGASLSVDSSAMGTVVYVALGARRPGNRPQPHGGRR